jgi:hypothetical protein
MDVFGQCMSLFELSFILFPGQKNKNVNNICIVGNPTRI